MTANFNAFGRMDSLGSKFNASIIQNKVEPHINIKKSPYQKSEKKKVRILENEEEKDNSSNTSDEIDEFDSRILASIANLNDSKSPTGHTDRQADGKSKFSSKVEKF